MNFKDLVDSAFAAGSHRLLQVGLEAERASFLLRGRALGLSDSQMLRSEQEVWRAATQSPQSNTELWREGWERLLRDAAKGIFPNGEKPITFEEWQAKNGLFKP